MGLSQIKEILSDDNVICIKTLCNKMFLAIIMA